MRPVDVRAVIVRGGRRVVDGLDDGLESVRAAFRAVLGVSSSVARVYATSNRVATSASARGDSVSASTTADRDLAVAPAELDGDVDVDIDATVSVRRASDVDASAVRAVRDLEPWDYVATATVADAVVGWVCVRVERPVVVERRGVVLVFDGPYLWGLQVEPPYRERGVGSALVRSGTRFAFEDDVERVYAVIDVNNEPSRRLFERLGYAAVDDVRGSSLAWLSRWLGSPTTRRYDAEPADAD